MQNLPPLVLASQSPRRKQILESLNINFQTASPKDAEELHPTVAKVQEITKLNALKKAESLIKDYSKETVLIGCDTLVVLEDKVLGKPANPQEAKNTLELLSGKMHTVISGLALVSQKFGKAEWYASTKVTFKDLNDKEIAEYLKTKEPYDKAGSYAVQGMGTTFIERIDGSYTNVMGFPLELFLQELPKYTQIPLFQWFLP